MVLNVCIEHSESSNAIHHRINSDLYTIAQWDNAFYYFMVNRVCAIEFVRQL